MDQTTRVCDPPVTLERDRRVRSFFCSSCGTRATSHPKAVAVRDIDLFFIVDGPYTQMNTAAPYQHRWLMIRQPFWRAPRYIEWRGDAALQHFYGDLKFLEQHMSSITPPILGHFVRRSPDWIF